MRSIGDGTRGQAFTSPTWPLYLVVVAAIIFAWEGAKDAAAWASTVTIDGATAAMLTWVTTPTVSPLVLGLLVVAASGLTAVVVWMWENPYAGLKDDTRGQKMGPPPGFAFLMAAVILGLMVIVGEKVVTAAGVKLEAHLACLGLFACGPPGVLDIAITVVPVIAILAIFVWAARGGIPPRIR